MKTSTKVVLLTLGLTSLSCARKEDNESDTEIRNGQKVGQGATGPERLSTVGLSSGCTGSIIAEDLIMTAAHCMSGSITVKFGTNFYSPEDQITVASRKVHADYHPSGPYIVPNDIALLKLSRNIPAGFVPVKLLPATLSLASGEAVRQAGYGETLRRSGGAFGTLRTVENTYSGRTSSGRITVANENFEGTCAGDSGGPLFVSKGGTWYVTGALSGGMETESVGCHGGGTYTGVPAFRDWIVQAAKELTGREDPFGGADPGPGTGPGTGAPTVLNLGPFGDGENKAIGTLSAEFGKKVNFKLTIDIESHASCGYDYLVIESGNGYKSQKLCGAKSFTATNFETPVTLRMVTDGDVTSKSVKLSAIEFFDGVSRGQQQTETGVADQ